MEASTIISAKDLNLYYGENHALKGIDIEIPEHQVTALIGPSGCGKSTFLKTLNRMNDLVPNIKIEGTVEYRGHNIYAPKLDVTWLRRHVGMVFQKPNPFPMITKKVQHNHSEKMGNAGLFSTVHTRHDKNIKSRLF